MKLQEYQEYNYNYNFIDIKDLITNKEKYIRPDISPIIDYLWSRNILARPYYTDSEVRIRLGTLSKENKERLEEIKRNRQNSISDLNANIILSDNNEIDISNNYRKGQKNQISKDVVDLLFNFQIQDIQSDGYMTIEQFLSVHTGLTKTIKNPNKISEPKFEDYENTKEGLEKYIYDTAKYDSEPDYITVFAENEERNPDDYDLNTKKGVIDYINDIKYTKRYKEDTPISVKEAAPKLENYNLDTEEGRKKYIEDNKEYQIRYSNFIEVKPPEEYLKDFKPFNNDNNEIFYSYKENTPIFIKKATPKLINYDLYTEEGRKEYIKDHEKYQKMYSKYIEAVTTKKDSTNKDYTFYDCYDKEEGKIYYCIELYDAHKRFKELMKEINNNNHK